MKSEPELVSNFNLIFFLIEFLYCNILRPLKITINLTVEFFF